MSNITKRKIKINSIPIIENNIPILETMPETIPNTDNYITTQYKSAPCVVEFLLRNAYYAMNCVRCNTIFEPIPPSWEQDQIDIRSCIVKYQIVFNIEIVLRILKESYNDAELIDKLNEKTYELLRFILESNKMMIKADSLLKSTDVISTTQKDITPEDNIKYLQFKLIHTQMTEDIFTRQKTRYLYHGSRYENWYSIMRNGVKIGSKNKYFLNGAAHGTGIYLSNDINMSINYSRNTTYSISPKTEDQMILAIFEVIDNPKWHKTGNIFVVNDENALIIRYLIIFNSDNASSQGLQSIFNAINIKLNSGGIKALENEKIEMEKKQIVSIHNKRLMREYQLISKQPVHILGYRIELPETDNFGKWMFYITTPQNENLIRQMQKLGIPAIEIEIMFKETYPIAPPFIRIVYPRFTKLHENITSGGSLCIEMLTNQGWNPTFNVENAIKQIMMIINMSGIGKIDETNWNRRYSMEEALDAFNKVLAQRGWV